MNVSNLYIVGEGMQREDPVACVFICLKTEETSLLHRDEQKNATL